MPIAIHQDPETKLWYVQYGTSGHKYYFSTKSVKSFMAAANKCRAQVRAIYAKGFKEP